MKKKIAILTTGHPPFDERIYWKFSKSLSENNFSVGIFCSTEHINTISEKILIKGFDGNNIKKKGKIFKFSELLKEFAPDIIICCEPLAVIPAKRFKRAINNNCKITLDVTEWYPENIVSKYSSILKRTVYYIIYFLFNIYATNLADAIIIGEISKKGRYNLISPFKKKIIIGYYPVLNCFNYYEPILHGNILTLCYAGVITFERGIINLLKVSTELAKKHKNLKIKLKVMGKFTYHDEENNFDALCNAQNLVEIERVKWTEYPKMSINFRDIDICFDLRKRNFIYRNSLPIKIFEYMASGKPFIYSDIEPIRKELKYENFGFLVDPNNIKEIIEKIESYIENPELLKTHSRNARSEIINGKNWETESKKLIDFIKSV